jgi:hypothetical protein
VYPHSKTMAQNERIKADLAADELEERRGR